MLNCILYINVESFSSQPSVRLPTNNLTGMNDLSHFGCSLKTTLGDRSCPVGDAAKSVGSGLTNGAIDEITETM